MLLIRGAISLNQTKHTESGCDITESVRRKILESGRDILESWYVILASGCNILESECDITQTYMGLGPPSNRLNRLKGAISVIGVRYHGIGVRYP